MWLPFPGGNAALAGDPLRRCVRAILVESYGLDEDDELVGAVLRDLIC